jgi:serine/threonine-protein kinase HipA
MPHTLEVSLGDRPVGTITNLDSDHNVFTFDSAYADDNDRPTLSLSFYDAERTLSAPTKTPQVRLLPFFANLLPEGHLRQYLANRAHVNPVRDFPLLALLGEDLPGAVVVRHHEGSDALLGETEPVVSKTVVDDPAILKFSLAGVQLKFSAIVETDGGLTIPVHGQNGDWMLKMPSAVYANVPENEFAMLTFARAVEIDVPDIALVDPESVRNIPPEVRTDLGRALSIKRFDRDGARRIHAEDFNQIYNQYPHDKYNNVSYGNMLSGIWRVMGEEQAREFVRRLVFSIGIGNADMHLKNWSVVYSDGRTPRLAPAYDYVSTVAYIDDDALALTIARTKQWADISYDRLERFARRSGVPRGLVLESAREMVARMREVWPQVKRGSDLPDRAIARIDSQMDSVPIFSGRAVFTGVTPPASETHHEIH